MYNGRKLAELTVLKGKAVLKLFHFGSGCIDRTEKEQDEGVSV